MKYNNYKELLAAYESGELTEPVMMDGDVSFVYVGEGQVFQGKGDRDAADIMEAVGILVDWA